MTKIPPERVKRDNSNLYAYSVELDRALKKDRGRNPDLSQDYALFAAITPSDVNPYPMTEFAMDLDAFRETLSDDNRLLMGLYLQEYTPKEMSEVTRWAQKTIYYRLKRLRILFKKFYLENENEY